MAVEILNKSALTLTPKREYVFVGEIPLIKEIDRNSLIQISKDTWNSLLLMANTNTGLIDDKIWPEKVNKVEGKTSLAYVTASCVTSRLLASKSLIDPTESTDFTKKNLNTLLHLERDIKSGLFYQWYNTSTGELVERPFIPTIDNAIAIFCLYLLQNDPDQNISSLAANILDLGLDLNKLYDHKENLFRGGYEKDNNKPTDFHLDMLTSESRFATYLGIEYFGIPEINYWRLGRNKPAEKGETVKGKLYVPHGEWDTWARTTLEITLSSMLTPEEVWSPVFHEQQKNYIHKQIARVGFVDPCDNEEGKFLDHGDGRNGAQCDGTQSLASIFSCLPYSPDDVLDVIAQVKQIEGIYHEGFGFRDSYKVCEDGSIKIAPTHLSFSQTRILLGIFNYLYPGEIQSLTSSLLDKRVRGLIQSEPQIK